jgi:hypothetical protein
LPPERVIAIIWPDPRPSSASAGEVTTRNSSIRSTLIPDVTGPADATVMCADEDVMRKLLAGELNPFIASMRRMARIAGDRGFGTRVALGLQVESPFAPGAGIGDMT